MKALELHNLQCLLKSFFIFLVVSFTEKCKEIKIELEGKLNYTATEARFGDYS